MSTKSATEFRLRLRLRYGILPSLLAIGLFGTPLSADEIDFHTQQPVLHEACSSIDINRFGRDIDYNLFVGPKGSVSKFGFTHEVDLPREMGTVFWCHLNPTVAEKNIRNWKPALSCDNLRESPLEESQQKMLAYLKDQQTRLGLTYGNEGEILEILARPRLQSAGGPFPESEFGITGGIQYSVAGRTLGELDIVVYRLETCDIVAIGEAKLCSESSCKKSLTKAHEQIERFMLTLYPALLKRDKLLAEWAERTESLAPISINALRLIQLAKEKR